MTRVRDVLDHPELGPELQREVERIERQADEREFRYCQQRGIPVSKALWRRIKRWRDKSPAGARSSHTGA